jgi:hypothetical protein
MPSSSRWFKGIAFLIAVSLTGCISQFHAGNWRPQDASVNSNYDICSRSPHWSMSGKGTLLSCMDERGYRLREMTTGEIIAAVVLFPLWFPVAFVTRGSSVSVLGPNDKAP